MVKILFPSSFELKTNQFSGKDFFLVLEFTYFWAEATRYFDGNDFFFGCHLLLDRKGVTPRNSAPVPPSLATLLWYSTYIRTGGTVFICLAVVQYLSANKAVVMARAP